MLFGFRLSVVVRFLFLTIVHRVVAAIHPAMAPAATLDPQPDKPQQAAMPATDLVASLPAPFLRLLILFATPIATLRTALEIVFWTPERRVESYLLVGGWWAFCLGFGYAFAWLIPPLVFAPLFPLGRLRLNSTPAPTHTIPATPATTETILVTVGDLHSISAIIPPSPVPHMSVIYNRFHQLGPWRLLRGLLVLWATWVVLGYALGTRVLVAITGSILLLLPSPPLAYVVNLLKKSLAVRRLVALTFILVFGSPERNYVFGSPMGWLKSKWYWSQHPAEALAFERVLDEAEEEELAAGTQAGNPVYFRFELHENQRWWMGLDWTSALLPQERPSWCDSHILPVSPPVAFTLPPPTSIDLPAPTRNEPRAQVRRTAAWRWLDDDWSVVRTGSGATASTAPATIVGMSSPSPTDDSSSDTRSIASIDLPRSSSRDSAASKQPRPSSGIFGSSPPQDDGHTRSPSMAEQAFAKGLGRLKNVNVPLASPVVSPTKAPSVRGRTGSEASGGGDVSIDDVVAGATPSGDAPIAPVDDATDADGWVYGDNKWENMTARGGLGKVSYPTFGAQLTFSSLAGDAGNAVQCALRRCRGYRTSPRCRTQMTATWTLGLVQLPQCLRATRRLPQRQQPRPRPPQARPQRE